MPDNESAELLERFRAGDERAAEQLFNRFAGRLIALAASKLSEKLARRLDAEDVVQSAYRSFFRGARDGRYVLQRSGELWSLLVSITLHKLQHQAERHTAGKRGVDREETPEAADSCRGLSAFALARDPSPLEAAALADEVESVLCRLEPRHRSILELRLQGHNLEEIAAQVKCSERTVRRVLEEVKGRMETDRR